MRWFVWLFWPLVVLLTLASELKILLAMR